MEWLTDPTIWVALLTLSVLEIILGIDNLIFIAILADKAATVPARSSAGHRSEHSAAHASRAAREYFLGHVTDGAAVQCICTVDFLARPHPRSWWGVPADQGHDRDT